MADYSLQIAELEALIQSATTDVSADGFRSKFDLDAARKRLNELRQLDDSATTKRPTLTNVRLGGAWGA